MNAVRIIRADEEVIVFGESPDALPPLDLPEATEPQHFGATWKQPGASALTFKGNQPSDRSWLFSDLSIAVIAVVVCAALVLARFAR